MVCIPVFGQKDITICVSYKNVCNDHQNDAWACHLLYRNTYNKKYILFTKTSCVNWHDESYASWVFQTCSVVLNDQKITEKNDQHYY